MPKFSEKTIDEIKIVNLSFVIPNTDIIKRSGTSILIECPICAKKMTFTESKNLAKCFRCGKAYVGPINFVKDRFNYNYPDALKYICDKTNIIPEYEY